MDAIAPTTIGVIRRFPLWSCLYIAVAVFFILTGLLITVFAVGELVGVIGGSSDTGSLVGGSVFGVVALLMGAYFVRGARIRGFGVKVDLDAVVSGLRAPDEDERIRAASQLYLVPGADGIDHAVSCLNDRSLVVRRHALRALVNTTKGFSRLAALLASDQEADQPARTTVLADLPGAIGKDARRELKGGPPGLDPIGLLSLLSSAARAAKSPESALPVFQVAVQCGAGGHFMWTYVEHRSPGFPNRCCTCGKANPMSAVPNQFQKTVDESRGPVLTLRRHVLSVDVPLCPDCEKKHGAHPYVLTAEIPTLVRAVFFNAEFQADLSFHPDWRFSGF